MTSEATPKMQFSDSTRNLGKILDPSECLLSVSSYYASQKVNLMESTGAVGIGIPSMTLLFDVTRADRFQP